MRTFTRSLIGFAAASAFLFPSLFNNQLVYNKAMFNDEPAKFETRLVDMHTGLADGVPVFYKPAKEVNKTELSRFFQMIKD